jgi:hypothetical protein
LPLVVRVLSESPEIIDRYSPSLGPQLEIWGDQVPIESVYPGRDRGVGGEYQTRSDPIDGGSEVAVLDDPVDELEHDESGMPFVEMMYRELPPERRQRSSASYPEHHFLIETMSSVAAIETIADVSIPFGVGLEIGVEEEEGDAPNFHPPYPSRHLATGKGDVHDDAGIDRADAVGCHQRVGLGLSSFGDVLCEVSVAIEEPYPDQGQSPVARRLEMVTGEDPEPTGVLGDQGGDPEFRGAVGDLGLHRLGQDLVQVGDLSRNPVHESTVGQQRFDLVRSQVGDDLHRMSSRRGSGEGAEKLMTRRVPSPSVIGGKTVQCLGERSGIQIDFSS